MEQTKKVIKETWNLADLALEIKDYGLRRRCLNDITNYTVLLNKFQDFLPAITSMKIVVDNNEFVSNTIPAGHILRVNLYKPLMN